MAKCLNTVKYNETLSMSECTDGFWLYDKTCGMNLAMRAKSKEEAFVYALTYYQKRLREHKAVLNVLRSKVEGFVCLFVNEVPYGSSSDIPDTVLEFNI